MSEIEKAREEQDAFRLREQAADARVIAAREKASAWSAKIEKAAEDRIREIAREEIEAHEERLMHEAMHGEINQEGGEAHSPGRHERPATGLDKSPPAVEAPAAGDSQEMADRLRSIARDPNNFITRAGSLIEAASMLADTTALARRLAEELSKIVRHVVVPETAIEALTEARKRGLIE